MDIGATGGSSMIMGPYTLDVGCTTTSLVFTQGAGFVTTAQVRDVGDADLAVYPTYS